MMKRPNSIMEYHKLIRGGGGGGEGVQFNAKSEFKYM